MLRRVAVLSARFHRHGPLPSVKSNPRSRGNDKVLEIRKPPIDGAATFVLHDHQSNRPEFLTYPPIQAHLRFQQGYALEHLFPTGPGSFGQQFGLIEEDPDLMEASSTLKKRRLKMNKHKYRKRRKRDRRRSK